MAGQGKVSVTNKDLLPRTAEEALDDIKDYIYSRLYDFRQSRTELEDNWTRAWASYFGTPAAESYLRTQVLKTVGNVGSDWRHRINTGKAYEVVETIHGYFMSALFPNSQWFNVESLEPMMAKMARLLRKYFANQLENWNYQSHVESWLRQMIITGSSCMFMPWVGDNIEFEVVDNFDIYVDPRAYSADKTPIIRRFVRTRTEILEDIASGYYQNMDDLDLTMVGSDYLAWEDDRDKIKEFQGLDLDNEISMGDGLYVYEYWGDIHLKGICYYDVYVVLVGDKVVRFEPNPYDCGKPFVFCTYTQVVRAPYGMSAIQSSMGLLHELNIVTNQRLDNVEIAVNTMFTKKASSILRSEDVWVEPGRVFEVSEHDDLQPVMVSKDGITVSYQESSFLESSVEKNTGTGPLISVGQPRGGERVTASEVQMVREAGSNRLSNNHKHIERTGVIPTLSKVLSIVRQFATRDEIVRIAGAEPNSYEYYEIGPYEIRNQKFRLRPRGADYIIEQRDYIQKRTTFIQLVVSVPQFAERIDFERILIDLLNNWGFEEPEAYLIQQEAQSMEPAPGSLQAMGGAGLEQAVKTEMMSDGGNQFLQDTTGLQLPEGINVNDLLTQYFEQETPGTRNVPLRDGGN